MLLQEAAAQARFLSSKQAFDIWLELATPESHGQQGDEVFQVCHDITPVKLHVANRLMTSALALK